VSEPLQLRARSQPLSPRAAVAEGTAALLLAQRLLALSDPDLARLSGVAAPGLLAVLGAADDLPWVDGVRYLGADPGAPGLLLQTTLAFDLPAALVERALRAQAPPGAGPLALLLAPLRLLPLGEARPIDRTRLATWVERAR
jgi:hypothetical protein